MQEPPAQNESRIRFCKFRNFAKSSGKTLPWQTRLNPVFYRKTAAVGVPEEYEAHDRQEILITRIGAVGAQVIGAAPEPFF